jgi:hypothetical protein
MTQSTQTTYAVAAATHPTVTFSTFSTSPPVAADRPEATAKPHLRLVE